MKLERLLGLVFGLAICATLVACGEDTDTENNPVDPSEASAPSDPSNPPEETRAQAILALSGDASNGSTVYGTNCSGCHLVDGSGTDGQGTGTNLQGFQFTEESVNSIIDGIGSMPPLGQFLTDQEIADIIAHIETF